jgi:hypothetical protein
MRTKALLAGAMIGAASLATSMAQVYSVNIVGYVNTTFAAQGFTMAVNPLNNPAGNTVANLMPSFTGAVNYMRIYKWDPIAGVYDENTWTLADPSNEDPGGWVNPNMLLNPGQGFFMFNANPTPISTTFVGEVPTGNLVTPVYRGFNMVGSMVPQQETIGNLGYVPTDLSYERIYRWDNSLTPPAYSEFTYTWPNPSEEDPGGWSPSEPTIPVGGAVFLYRPTGTSNAWSRTFNVQ